MFKLRRREQSDVPTRTPNEAKEVSNRPRRRIYTLPLLSAREAAREAGLPTSDSADDRISMLNPGDLLSGRYEIKRLIGRGGMGEVYEAVHTHLGKKVAIKVLLHNAAGDAVAMARERFDQEARATANIRHPNIVDVFDIGNTPNGSLYMAMEYLTGESLETVLEETRLSPERAINITLQLCGALQAAHEASIVHRDLKPANIFLVDASEMDGFVKILDFGIATYMGESYRRLTADGGVIGTFEYMSPEQINGKRVDHRSDIYSLAVVLYQMLTGTVPFKSEQGSMAERYATLSRMQLNERPPPMRKRNHKIPDSLESVVMRALEKDPQKRYQTMTAFAEALRSCSHGASTENVTNQRAVKRFYLGAVMVGIIAAIWATAALLRSKDEPELSSAVVERSSSPVASKPERPELQEGPNVANQRHSLPSPEPLTERITETVGLQVSEQKFIPPAKLNGDKREKIRGPTKRAKQKPKTVDDLPPQRTDKTVPTQESAGPEEIIIDEPY